jgi:hypothetical protein
MEYARPGSAKANGREPKSCLNRVFNFKLGCFVMCRMAWPKKQHTIKTAKLIIENLAQTSLGYLPLAYTLPAHTHH